ncbi:hypothetical protein ACWM35_23060 [Neobacillus sp. K501]
MKKKFIFGLCLFAVVVVAITLISNYNVLQKKEDKAVVNKKSDDKISQSNNQNQTIVTDKNRNVSTSIGQGDERNSTNLDGDSSEINDEIRERFQEINSMADKRLDSLIEQAQEEYRIKKDKNEDLSLFQSKYKAIMEHYEEKTEAEFNLIYKQLENDIFQKKLSSTVGQEFMNTYMLKKDQRMIKLLNEIERIS